MKKVILNNDQSISLAVTGYTVIDKAILYKISRHDDITEALNLQKPGDVIAQNSIAVFILNPARNV